MSFGFAEAYLCVFYNSDYVCLQDKYNANVISSLDKMCEHIETIEYGLAQNGRILPLCKSN